MYRRETILPFVFGALVLFDLRIESILTRGPSDGFAVRGSTVVLLCHTNLSVPVAWQRDNKKGGWLQIYQGNPGVINTIDFSERFSVSENKSYNQYKLIIKDVRIEDAGTYRCVDCFGYGRWKYDRGEPNEVATAELIVIDVADDGLNCSQKTEEFANKTHTSEHKSCLITIRCSFVYGGHIQPSLRLMFIKNKTSIKEGEFWKNFESKSQSIQDDYFRNDAVFNVIIKQGMIGGKFKCGLSRSKNWTITDPLDQMSWSSKVISNDSCSGGSLHDSDPELKAKKTSWNPLTVFITVFVAILLLGLIVCVTCRIFPSLELIIVAGQNITLSERDNSANCTNDQNTNGAMSASLLYKFARKPTGAPEIMEKEEQCQLTAGRTATKQQYSSPYNQ